MNTYYNDDAFVSPERFSDFFLGLDLAPVSEITALVIVLGPGKQVW